MAVLILLNCTLHCPVTLSFARYILAICPKGLNSSCKSPSCVFSDKFDTRIAAVSASMNFNKYLIVSSLFIFSISIICFSKCSFTIHNLTSSFPIWHTFSYSSVGTTSRWRDVLATLTRSPWPSSCSTRTC